MTAIDRDSRLFLSHKEGPRDSDNSEALFLDIEKKRDIDSSLPIFVSDDWGAFDLTRIPIPPYNAVFPIAVQ